MTISNINILKNRYTKKYFANTCVLGTHKGFTLIELLVVMAIIAIISSILFSDYPSVRDRIAVTSAAHKLSLALREAQAYGASAGIVSGTSTLGQAVRIVTSENITRNDNNYVLTFADGVDASQSNADASIKLSNMKYDASEKIADRTFGFEGGVRIDKISVDDGSGSGLLDMEGNVLEIYFMRPESRARIYTESFPESADAPNGCPTDDAAIRRTRNLECYSGYKEAAIQLIGAGNAGYKCVKVYYIGQITISSGECNPS